MKHEDLLGQNAQLHNKLYQMLRDRILRLMEAALIYGETPSVYFIDVMGITKEVTLSDGREMVVEMIYQEDEQVTLTAHLNKEEDELEEVFTYIWVGGLVNILLVEDAIEILNGLEKQEAFRFSYQEKSDAYVQTLERAFQSLGGVLTKKMKASDYVEMRKKEGSQ